MKKPLIQKSEPNLDLAFKRSKTPTKIDYDSIIISDRLKSYANHKKAFIRTYGCQANVVDSENMQGILQELPEKQRAIVELRDVENKTYKEIASALNITEEQVKSYLFRARQKIRLRYTEIQDYGL